MSGDPGSQSGGPPPDRMTSNPDMPLDDDSYDPGDTLNRGMSIACSLVFLFFALVSCGFIISVLTLHR